MLKIYGLNQHYSFWTDNRSNSKGIAKTNYANADTLYKIGMGRFQVGTVTQDELLKLELSLLNAEQALSMAQLEEKERRQV